jgi:hypothetical protein
MRKILLMSIGALLMVNLQAQVVMALQLPPLGLTMKPQLWNLSLINTGSEAISVRIEVQLTDVATGLRVFTGTSKVFNLARGVNQVQPGTVMPINYDAGNPGYPVDPSPDGFLPIGIFNICYTVTKVNIDAPEQLSEDCVTLEVEPLSPPQLIMPLDSEHVEFTRPFFAWSPPAPVNSFGTTLYDWILVEVQPTQSAADAIQQNIPVYTQQNVLLTTFQYPLSMPELDSSKLYAWRITAKNIISPVASSEIWTFRVRKYEHPPAPVMAPGYFAKLHREENSAFIICNGILRFEFEHDQNSTAANIQIFDISSNQRKRLSLDSTTYPVKYGQNIMQLDLRETSGMVDKHMYLLELVNAKNERWYLKFEYRRKTDQQ